MHAHLLQKVVVLSGGLFHPPFCVISTDDRLRFLQTSFSAFPHLDILTELDRVVENKLVAHIAIHQQKVQQHGTLQPDDWMC